MAYSYGEFKKMSDKEIIALHDSNVEAAPGAGYSFSELRAEIALRSQDRATEVMLKYTKQVTVLTWLTTVVAAGALFVSIVAIIHH